jgi:alkylhydroperoxidase family enzyme
MLPPWLAYSATMMPFGALGRAESELVILRVAALKGNSGGDYEMDHHTALGKKAGLIEGDIAAATRIDEGWEPGRHGFHGRRGAMLDVADEIVQFGDVSDPAWGRLASFLSDRECVALVRRPTSKPQTAICLPNKTMTQKQATHTKSVTIAPRKTQGQGLTSPQA